MEIIRITETTDEVMAAFERLLPQLSPECKIPSRYDIEDIIYQPSSYLFGAKSEGHIVGTLTLIVYKTPTGCKAWIEDVVVDASQTGKGVGRQLIDFAIGYCRKLELDSISLTSRPERVVANALYKKLGFKIRETNVYKLDIKD